MQALALTLTVVLSTAHAVLTSAPLQPEPANTRCSTTKPSVLIIGAGPSGTSTAFHISRGPLRQHADVSIFEKETRVGGRVLDAVITDASDGSKHCVELGASIFLEGNLILYSASAEFGLLPNAAATGRTPALYAGERSFAIFNGQAVEFSPSHRFFLFSMLWRYGWSLLRGKGLAAEALVRFKRIYKANSGFETPSKLAAFIDWSEYLTKSALKFFRAAGISDRYMTEVVQGISRTNYAQNLADENVIAALCGIIPSPAITLPGGNARVFELMAARSGARLQLNTTVTRIRRADGRGYVVTTDAGESSTFDVVVLAAPTAASAIQFELPVDPPSSNLKYVRLHVTVVLGTVNESYFGTNLAVFPRLFLTLPSCTAFNSFSTLKRLWTRTSAAETWQGRGIFKIFSNQAIGETLLSQLFVGVEQVIRQDWDSYPYLLPRSRADDELSSFVVHELYDDAKQYQGGVYQGAGFEGVMSSMESQAVAGRNLALLLATRMLPVP